MSYLSGFLSYVGWATRCPRGLDIGTSRVGSKLPTLHGGYGVRLDCTPALLDLNNREANHGLN